jgi:hypothetical protein
MNSIQVGTQVQVLAQCSLEGATGTVTRLYSEAIGGGLNHGPLITREYAIVSLPGYPGERHFPTAVLAAV